MKLWEGNVFTHVCLFTGGVGQTPWRQTPWEGTWDQMGSDIISLGSNNGPDRKWHHTPSYTIIWYWHLVAATKPGCTHPTGMHTCYCLQMNIIILMNSYLAILATKCIVVTGMDADLHFRFDVQSRKIFSTSCSSCKPFSDITWSCWVISD